MSIQENELQTVIGVVDEVVYYNDENGYAVCYVSTEKDIVAVVGYLPYIAEGESVRVTGTWTFHPDYGPQLKAEQYEKTMPQKEADILKYLSSGIIRGVRVATAQKIVDCFGEQTLDVISNTPEKLAQVPGISRSKAMEIGKSYAEQLGVRDVVMFLQKHGVSPHFAVQVYKHYGTAAVDVVKTNPYVLAAEVYGIGFQTVDRMAMNMGIRPNAAVRIEAAVSYVLWNATMSGHTFLPREQLVQQTYNLLGVDEMEVSTAISSLLFAGKLCNEPHKEYESIYQPALHRAEVQTAAKLLKLSGGPSMQTTEQTEKLIEMVEREQGIVLAKQQREAVHTVAENGVTVITGGPGTGKTTIIRVVLRMMEQLEQKVMLAAPTGRAAKRMTELCGVEAKTIHRLLEAGFLEDDEGMQFAKGEDDPLDCDVLIVDEMSMVDILLMSSVLKALKNGTRLVLVGDSDQLPSVRAGYVLRDIIESGAVAVVALTEIFRQAQQSAIVVNAHRINRGEYPLFNEKGSDFFMMQREHAGEVVQTIIDLCTTRLPSSYHFSPLEGIQVLTPTKKGPTGVQTLNEKMQAALNPPAKGKREKPFRGIVFREGDKVMQVKNNYDLEWTQADGTSGAGVFNGDVGYVKEINKDKETLSVQYDDRVCTYDFGKLDELELAYAMTIHKSQGSEFDAVVMPMYPCAPMLQNRNLLYTAVTRAKQLVVLVGRAHCVAKMVDNVSDQKRYSGLADKLKMAKQNMF